MQNKAIRSITNSQYNESAIPLYKQLNILPLKHQYEQQLGKLMYILSLHIQNIFPLNTYTRHVNNPHFQRFKAVICSILLY